MSNPTFRALCAELLDCDDGAIFGTDLVARASAALAQTEPAELTDEKILSLADDCGLEAQEITNWDGKSRTVDHGWECTDAQLLTFGRAFLARYACPTFQPVPVSERLPGDDECRPNPRTGAGHWCWGFIQHDPYSFAGRWRMMKREWLTDEADFWAPHWALPMPANTTPEATND